MVGKYRLCKDLFVVDDETHAARILPEGSIIEVSVEPPEGHRMMVMAIGGRQTLMFTADLRRCGERIRSVSRSKSTVAQI